VDRHTFGQRLAVLTLVEDQWPFDPARRQRQVIPCLDPVVPRPVWVGRGPELLRDANDGATAARLHLEEEAGIVPGCELFECHPRPAVTVIVPVICLTSTVGKPQRLAGRPCPRVRALVVPGLREQQREPLLGLDDDVAQLREGLAEQDATPLSSPSGPLRLALVRSAIRPAVLSEVHDQGVSVVREHKAVRHVQMGRMLHCEASGRPRAARLDAPDRSHCVRPNHTNSLGLPRHGKRIELVCMAASNAPDRLAFFPLGKCL